VQFDRNTLEMAATDVQSIEYTLQQWGSRDEFWIFGYASLIWRPDFEVVEKRRALLNGWHRSLKMWSRINRGTPQRPGLVFALLPGGSCQGMVMRIDKQNIPQVMQTLWSREMPSKVYNPRWVWCKTEHNPVRALAFTLPKSHPNYTGNLSDEQYREIFNDRVGGLYGSTIDYARATQKSLEELGIFDRELDRLLALASTD
jgi:cation transport protein ChaC